MTDEAKQKEEAEHFMRKRMENDAKSKMQRGKMRVMEEILIRKKADAYNIIDRLDKGDNPSDIYKNFNVQWNRRPKTTAIEELGLIYRWLGTTNRKKIIETIANDMTDMECFDIYNEYLN